jgi:hypothetical protein
MKSIETIKSSITNKESFKIIARKIFLSYPTFAFFNREEMEFQIKNEVSGYFKIAFGSVQIGGSSKTGFSPYKNRGFVEGESDLDVAIINNPLFTTFSEISHMQTKGYSDLSKFTYNSKTGQNDFHFFQSNLSNGYFRPDLMPNSKEKSEWFTFFNQLSNKYFEIFKSINAGIYASEYFFETKQIDCIRKIGRLNIAI